MADTPSTGPLRVHPVVTAELQRRQKDVQLRIADAITAFAGSMRFVYLHAVVFAAWMVWFEKRPWPTLTLVVSLEAIFLSTFVMIGQNRQSAFSQAKANHDFSVADQELHDNTEMTRQIRQLTTEIHDHYVNRDQAMNGGPASKHGGSAGASKPGQLWVRSSDMTATAPAALHVVEQYANNPLRNRSQLAGPSLGAMDMRVLGRAADRSAIDRALSDARNRLSTAMVLCGEPGMGKTTLVGLCRTFRRQACGPRQSRSGDGGCWPRSRPGHRRRHKPL
jgi:hypothetical protein